MKIVYEDLLRFLKKKPSVEDLSNKLFQLGHEHQIDGNIFDIEFTPNRGDCLSLLGLARDLNYFYDSIDFPEIFSGEMKDLDLSFKNNSSKSCPTIYFLKIEIEDIPNKYLDYVMGCQPLILGYADPDVNNIDISKRYTHDTIRQLSYYKGEKEVDLGFVGSSRLAFVLSKLRVT